jgi:CheY-like chemotaxis protein
VIVERRFTSGALRSPETRFHTTTAIDGISAAAEFRPDAILLDIGMPRINGYELPRRIRAETWGGDILLIAVTGWGQSSDS